MATAWPISAGARGWASDRQGMEAPWTLDLAQKDTKREIKHQNTPRDSAEHGEDEADAQGTGDRRIRHKPTRYRQFSCCYNDALIILAIK